MNRARIHSLVLVLIGILVGWISPAGSPAWAIWPFDGPNEVIDLEDPRGSAARVLQRAIQFDTTNPPGDERPLADYLVRILRGAGVESRVIETPRGTSQVGRGAVWARFPGTGRRRPIVLLSHLDVVPAVRSDWALDPFEGLVGGGHVVGRGALDAKGIAIVHLFTLLTLAERGRPLERDVILLAVPDEETGGRAGSDWLVSHIWGVTFTEKSPCWLELTARGRPGHGSAAGREGAVPTLVAALERVRSIESEVRVTPEVEQMFRTLAPYAAGEDRVGLADLGRSLRLWPDFRQRFLAEPGRNALVRNTLAITVLRAGERTNVVPAEARAEIDARLLPGESCPAFVEMVRRTIDDPEVRIETLLDVATAPAPVETDLFRAIERVATSPAHQGVVVPRVIAGFTDAHYYRDLGIVAYGFVPRWLRPRDTRGIHGPNERISLDNLELGIKTTIEILDALDAKTVQ
jgi:acetylornithine deacetylase/succinyl-diaminopimelate desuccinylase-like protein